MFTTTINLSHITEYVQQCCIR